jgi:hypothetical protein
MLKNVTFKQWIALAPFVALSLVSSTGAQANRYLQGTDRILQIATVDGSTHELSIHAPDPLEQVRIVETAAPAAGAAGQIAIFAHISSESVAGIEAMASSGRLSLASPQEGSAEFRMGAGTYMCERHEYNGEVQVKGTCLEELVINVPVGNKTAIHVNGKLVRLLGAMSAAELRAELPSATFDDGKVELVKRFVASHGTEARIIEMSDVVAVLKALTFDDGRASVAELLSGRVIDPQNAGLARQAVTFESNRDAIVAALSK